MFRGLRSRLTIIFLGLAILPVAAIIGVLSERTVATLQEEAVQRQRQDAELAAANIESFINERDNQLTFLTEAKSIGFVSPDQQRSLLNDLIAYDPAYYELALLDSTGQELHRIGRSAAFSENDLMSRADSEEFLQPKETGAVYFSPVRFDETAREPLVTIAHPVFDLRTNDLVLVLVAEFRFRPVWNLIAEIDLGGPNDDIYVTDVEGRLIAHSNPSLVLQGIRFDLPSNNGRNRGLTNEDVILARQTIQFGDQQFVVVAERPVSDAFSLINEAVQVVLTVAGAVAIIVIGLIFLSVRQVVRPIENLSQAAQKVSAGDLSVEVPVRGNDEIAEMGRAFNSMTVQLHDLIHNLERRVQVRTADLQIAADVATQITTILDLDELLNVIVAQVQAQFDFYHTSVFLYREDEQRLELVAAHGRDGRGLTPGEKVFNMDDTGIVPKAATSMESVISNDVTSDPAYFANPVLPATRSEMAVPIIVGNKLVGVLDMQAEAAGRFTEEETRVLPTLAKQIGIALENARLYSEAEEARLAAEKADQIKSQFLANMSHELRTPLNSIINFTKFVVRGVMGPVTEKQESTLTNVVNSAEHLLALINDVLDISKIESGSLTLFMEDDIHLHALIESASKTVHSLLSDKDVDFKVDVPADLPTFRGDGQRILQVLLNILSNACKFTDEGEIRVSAAVRDNEILVEVADTGPGIAANDHAAVFEKFRQTPTGLRQGSGTGLGMPISRSLVEAHGGRIWIESQSDEGVTFCFTLPLEPVKANLT